jgi:hypothetical protein
MDPIVLSRLLPGWRAELIGATWAGLRPTRAGFAAVFDRAPDGERPGRRLALVVRLAPPLWAWLDDAGRDSGRDFAYRPPEDTQITGAAALPLDRGFTLDALAPGDRPLRLHVELWAPGNLIVEETGRRIVWCARARGASTKRGAIAPDAPYPPPPPTSIVDPTTLDHATLESILYGLPADERLVALAKRCAGLPKGALEALAPGLPPALFDEARVPDEAMAAALRAWAEHTYAPEATSISGLAWNAPSPGAHLIAVAPCAEPHASWNEAARSVGRGLPEPVDADALALAKGRVKKLERTVAALMDDIAGAAEAADVRARARALVAFLPRVTRGAASVTLPDPADPSRTFDIALDPKLRPHENVDRLFTRAGKLERAAERAPELIEAARADLVAAKAGVAAIERGEEGPAVAPRREARPGGTRGATPERKSAGKGRPSVPSALEPRRYRTSEGWEVWIGKNNQGNDHLTHRMARPEDIWMHVHGAAGSHVVLRRGKGPNEPSKTTLAEVAGWAAFYSQARNAGTVPVTVTEKKYVRKPRKAPAGLAEVMRSKTVFARPTEPPDSARLGDGD